VHLLVLESYDVLNSLQRLASNFTTPIWQVFILALCNFTLQSSLIPSIPPTDLQCCQAKKVQDYFQKPRTIRMHSTVSSLCNEILKIFWKFTVYFKNKNLRWFKDLQKKRKLKTQFLSIIVLLKEILPSTTIKWAWHRYARSHAHSRYSATRWSYVY